MQPSVVKMNNGGGAGEAANVRVPEPGVSLKGEHPVGAAGFPSASLIFSWTLPKVACYTVLDT